MGKRRRERGRREEVSVEEEENGSERRIESEG